MARHDEVPPSAAFSIVPADPFLPGRLGRLSDDAASERIGIIDTVCERWIDGTERYRAEGEMILAAIADVDGEVVGIGGLTQCPDVAGALRMRRFYVGPPWRRRGVAHDLATELIASGWEHTDLLTCNAGASPAAPTFWEQMGFIATDDAGITHALRRGDGPEARGP